jgi:hypothetical protein
MATQPVLWLFNQRSSRIPDKLVDFFQKKAQDERAVRRYDYQHIKRTMPPVDAFIFGILCLKWHFISGSAACDEAITT